MDVSNLGDCISNLSVLKLSDPMAASLLDHLVALQCTGEARTSGSPSTEPVFGVPWHEFKLGRGAGTLPAGVKPSESAVDSGVEPAPAGTGRSLFTVYTPGTSAAESQASPPSDSKKIHRVLF